MSVTKRQWEAVLGAALRMQHMRCEDHTVHDEACPYCQDVAAYQELLAAFPSIRAKMPAPLTGAPVDVWDLHRTS